MANQYRQLCEAATLSGAEIILGRVQLQDYMILFDNVVVVDSTPEGLIVTTMDDL